MASERPPSVCSCANFDLARGGGRGSAAGLSENPAGHHLFAPMVVAFMVITDGDAGTTARLLFLGACRACFCKFFHH
jgi:hypothetical protein